MPGFPSRKEEHTGIAPVEMVLIVPVHMGCRITSETVPIIMPSGLFVSLPVVVCFGSCGVPVIEDLMA
jgi:hypothetical protein